MTKQTSERKIVANRRNALKSTGPKTADGKRTISKNALKHGILSKDIVIDGVESQEEYDSFLAAHIGHYQPVGPVEEMLVSEIANGSWRLSRVRRYETGVTTQEFNDRFNRDAYDSVLARIHRRTPMDGVRKAEGGVRELQGK